jgi:hypothetical protein
MHAGIGSGPWNVCRSWTPVVCAGQSPADAAEAAGVRHRRVLRRLDDPGAAGTGRCHATFRAEVDAQTPRGAGADVPARLPQRARGLRNGLRRRRRDVLRPPPGGHPPAGGGPRRRPGPQAAGCVRAARYARAVEPPHQRTPGCPRPGLPHRLRRRPRGEPGRAVAAGRRGGVRLVRTESAGRVVRGRPVDGSPTPRSAPTAWGVRCSAGCVDAAGLAILSSACGGPAT